MCGKYSLTKFANFLIIVLRAKIVTTFGSKMITISARSTIIRRFANFARLYFPRFTTFCDQILEFYYFWKVVLTHCCGNCCTRKQPDILMHHINYHIYKTPTLEKHYKLQLHNTFLLARGGKFTAPTPDWEMGIGCWGCQFTICYTKWLKNGKLRKAIYYPHFTTFRNETSEYY